MDRNGTMDRRFSLNMTHLPNPIAESTCLNLNGTSIGIGDGHKSDAGRFRWGGSPISPQNRSNSSICCKKNSVHKNNSRANCTQRSRMDLSKIDPRTYADVRSRGLVSRIVQYHENGSRLNRSMSTGNLYNKSGQSCFAQLQKSELPYRATQQNVSMTRMAPTKKSTFYGNTLSSLLRSNSVISVQKSDEEISCENRPILHPPPTENDLAPTRSVLDVLKEISRKRINSDESEPIHEANKKYCSPDCNDAPYNMSTSMSVSSMGIHGMVPPMSSPVQSYKRQREHILPPQQYPINYSQNMSSVSGTTTYPTSRPPLQTQYSPEQIAKKRLCSYNNDIASSLSSSLMHANKRKFYEQQQRSTIQRSPTNTTEEYETQKSKILRQQSDQRFQKITQNLSCNTPITPIPATPLLQNNTDDTNSTQSASEEITDPTALVKRRDLEAPLSSGKHTTKPKVTLFNRNYNASAILNNLNCNIEANIKNTVDLDDGECADIQFVKPKKSSAIANKKNSLIERTQKSKLAMMLSGLRGEIYQGENGDDEVDKIPDKDSGKTAKQSSVFTTIDKNTSKVFTTSTSTATTTTTTAATNYAKKVPDKSVATSPSASLPLLSESDSTLTVNSMASTSKTVTTAMSSPLSDIKLTASTANNSITTNTNISTTPIITTPKSTSPLVGLKLTPQKSAVNFDVTGGSTKPTFNFNASTTSAPTIESYKAVTSTTSAESVSAIPQLQGFSFSTTTKSSTSPPSSTKTNLATAAPPTTTADRVGGFKFGLIQQPENSSAVKIAVSTSSFGGFANVTPPTLPIGGSETLKPVLAFGSNPPSIMAAVVKPTVNFVSGTTTTTASGFSADTSATFTFGAGPDNSTKSSVPSTTAQVTASTAHSVNVFGSGVTSNAFTVPSFGSAPTITQSESSTATKPSFSFGGAAADTSNAGASAVVSTNLFAFGAQKSTAATTTTTTSMMVAPFSFGATTQTPVVSTSTTATTNATANKAIFSFSDDNQGAAKSLGGASNTNITTNGNLFSFGGASADTDNKLFGNTMVPPKNTQTVAPTPVQSNTFTFGAVTGQGSTPTFSGVSAGSATPAFGAPTTKSTTPFSFGGCTNMTNPTAAPTAAKTNNTTSGGFSFGATTTGVVTGNNATPTNIFGAASLSNTAAPNMAKTAFNFGGTSSDTAKSIFGGGSTANATNNASSNNAFDAIANAASNQTTKPFRFGGSANSSNTNTTSNPFGATANKPTTTGFPFASRTIGNKPTVTAGAQPSSLTPFAFGGSANTNQAAASTATPFSFGGSTSVAPANKTFSFGSNAPAAQVPNSGSIFGGGLQNSGNIQQGAAATFNFTAGTTAASASTLPASSSTANIFASPAPANGIGGGAATDRPIRRATRRLQKT